MADYLTPSPTGSTPARQTTPPTRSISTQRRGFYRLGAGIRHRGPYDHKRSIVISVEGDSPTGQDLTPNAEESVPEALCDLARWLYRRLEAEYERLTLDLEVDEAIVTNDDRFLGTGKRFG